MSKINILGIVNNIKSKSNVYTPIVEAVVNSIEAIGNKQKGKIEIIVHRELTLNFDDAKPYIISVQIIDNGAGFNITNRDSFDTYLSATKIDTGGKGFGRFMYLKYFHDVIINSQYLEDGKFRYRNFRFGKQDEIIVDETEGDAKDKKTGTDLMLKDIKDVKLFDKNLDVIARKLVEKLLVFFVDDSYDLPKITLREADKSNNIILNDFINDNSAISKVGQQPLIIKSSIEDVEYKFNVKVYKIYFSSLSSKICLTAHNREVTETTIHTYIPEFQDEFYDIEDSVRRNYIIKAYVLGDYLNDNVSLERESFDFPKDVAEKFYVLSQTDIEKEVAQVVKSFFATDVKSRFEKKIERVRNYVNVNAPWQ